MTEQRTRLQPLLEGALLAAIAVVLVLLEMLVPFLAPILIMIRPVPIAVAAFRQGTRIGVMTLVVAALVTGMFGGIFTLLIVGLVSGPIGLAFGLAFRRGLSPSKIFALGTLVLPVTLAVAVGIGILVTGINPLTETREIFVQSLDMSSQLYGKLGLGEQAKQFADMVKSLVELMFTTLLPATIVAVAVIQSWVNFSIIRGVLNRLGHKVEGLPPFSRWQLPYSIVWLFVAGYAAMWLGGRNNIALLTTAGQNIMFVMEFAFIIQGFSFIYFFFERWKFPRVISILILITLLFQQLFTQLVYFAGMFETVIQYRTTLVKRDESEASGTKNNKKKN